MSEDGVSINTLTAVQMLNAGWTVEYSEGLNLIRWRSPFGLSGSALMSNRLDSPPPEAIRIAEMSGHIKIGPRVPA